MGVARRDQAYHGETRLTRRGRNGPGPTWPSVDWQATADVEWNRSDRPGMA